ncbi:MAG: SDR family oxidoreductase [Aestuariibacter sp.]
MQKRVLVTGGASGLGKAIALCWAKSGADIVIADLHQERGVETVAEIQELGQQAYFHRCDVTQDDDVDALKNAVMESMGGIDLLVNNAGVATAGSLQEEDIEQWRWVLDINVLGVVRMARAFVPIMQKQGGGYLLNVASQAGITPAPLMASYSASKAAVVSFSETMKLELVDENIGVSVLCPGFFKTHLDESVRSHNPAMKSVVSKLLERSNVSAEQVAQCAFDAVQKNQFMILSHYDGKKAHRIKRWIPNYYFKMMIKHTEKFRNMGK